jgi:hypothetical protein
MAVWNPSRGVNTPKSRDFLVSMAERIGGKGMADVIFIALTIAVFVILGLVVKAVERL